MSISIPKLSSLIVIKVTDRGVLNLPLICRTFEKNFVPAVNLAMGKAADAYKERLQLAMANRKSPGPPLSPFTLAKRRYGKLAGRHPAIPAYQGIRPWMRTGTLMQSIKRTKVDYKTWSVGPEEGVVLPFSGSGSMFGIMTADRAAFLLEYGFTVTIPVTYRMQRYFNRMYYKATKSGGKKRIYPTDSKKTGRTITIRVPPRPVFHWVNDQMLDEYPNIIMEAFEKRLWKGVPDV